MGWTEDSPSSPPPPPAWRMPEGVDAALWSYAHDPRLARDEDAYFADSPLFRADTEFLLDAFREPGPLVDLGCGAGRHLLAFARRGFPAVGVDLSAGTLREVRARARAEGLDVGLAGANLCRLGCFPDGTFAYALSMFSTLGMIRGAEARARALAEAHRVLRPSGLLALHAHNLWLQARVPGGRGWLARQVVRVALGRPDAGDRRMSYRGVPNLTVHLFRWAELRGLLLGAGFSIERVEPIDAVSARPMGRSRWARRYRAGGWLVLARRPAARPVGGKKGGSPGLLAIPPRTT